MNNQNLRKLTSEQARDLQKKATEARKVNKRRAKTFMLALHDFMKNKMVGSEMTGAEGVVTKLAALALDGNVAAARLLFEMSGEKTDRVELTDGRKKADGLQEIYALLKKQEK